jgi:glycerol-3-phosphate dehydrogenase
MTPLDLLVIGGGITGLGVARLAARNGYSVTVVERGDLASGASSATSHMLHGGLRYLEHARFPLVHEALVERAAVSRMAPRLARPTRFLVPLYAGGRIGALKLRAGLVLYDWLAAGSGFPRHSWLRAGQAMELEPDLDPYGLRCAGQYSDAVMDDARLAIAVARDAAAFGARIETYTEVTGARPVADAPPGASTPIEVWVRDAGGAERPVVARVVVNAAGPWCDDVRRRLGRALRPGAEEPRPLLRPSRGIHLVYPRLTRDHGLLLTTGADGRAFFVVPFGAYSLVGTTEVEVASPPPVAAWRADLAEVRYLRDAARRALPGLLHEAPRALYTGVRPLLAGSPGGVGEASREHRVILEDGLVTISGGKYTTFRVMARDTMRQVAALLGRGTKPLHDPTDPLPAPLDPGTGVREAAEFAVAHEFATRLEDVMRRRSSRWLTPDRGRAAARDAAAAMAERLGWSEARTRDEIQSYDAARWEEDALLQRAGDHA